MKIDLYKQLPKQEKISTKDKKSISFFEDAFFRFKKNKIALFGLVTLLSIIFLAIIGPFLTPYSYFDIHLPEKNLPPSLKYWFGTDELGRDIFTRVWWGARISLTIGIAAALIDLLIGILWGTISAFIGGFIDEVMMRICDILHSLPYLLMVILLMVVLGPGMITIIIAIAIIGWINMARIIRGQMLQIKEMDFITAAKALGASHTRIIFRHLIPNTFGTIIVTLTLTIPSAIFTEAFLSFLGLGVQAPIASWGVMVSDSLGALRYYPHRLFFPALMITLTMLSFNLIGDGLRDAFDPKLRNK